MIKNSLFSLCSICLFTVAAASADTAVRVHIPAQPARVKIVHKSYEDRFVSIPSPGHNYDDITYDVILRRDKGNTYMMGKMYMPAERDDEITAPYIRLLYTNGIEFAMMTFSNRTVWSTGSVLQEVKKIAGLPNHYYIACGYAYYYDEMYPHMQGGPQETIVDATDGSIIYRGAMKNAQEYVVDMEKQTDVIFLGDTVRARVITPNGTNNNAITHNIDYAVYDAYTGQELFSDKNTKDVVLRPKAQGTYLVMMSAGTKNRVYWRTMRHLIVLPKLEWTDNASYLGRLAVNDSVDCGLKNDRHEMRGGGVVHVRNEDIVTDRITGSALTTVWQRTGRVVSHDQGFFSYTLGVGLKKNMPYLLEIEYPEDVPRTFAFVVGRGAYAPGIHTGTTLGQPEPRFFVEQIPFPLSSSIHKAQFLIWAGDFEARNGVFVGIADPGKKNAPFSKKPVVFKITLYDMITIACPRIAFPKDPALRRYAWVESEQMLPSDGVRYSPLVNTLFYGMNAVAPPVVSWNAHGNDATAATMFPSPLYPRYKRTIIRNKEYETDELEDVHQRFNFWKEYLEWAREFKIHVFPRLEYGGSDTLPKEAYAIGGDGAPYPPYIHTYTGKAFIDSIDVTHTATFADVTALIDDMFNTISDDLRAWVGPMIFRRRADFLATSYSETALKLFMQEQNKNYTGSFASIRTHIIAHENDTYRKWYQQKINDFLMDIKKSYDNNLPRQSDVLLYYHWRHTGMPFIGVYRETASDWENSLKRRRSLPYEGFPLPTITCDDLVKAVATWMPLQDALYPAVFNKKILPVAPVYGDIAAKCKPYLDMFAHTNYLAVKITPNVNINTRIYRKEPGINNAGTTLYRSREHSFFEAIQLMCTKPPTHLGFEQSHPPCFPSAVHARRFFMNYLSLPRISFTPVAQTGKAKEIFVSMGKMKDESYIAVVNPTFNPVAAQIDVPLENVQQLHKLVEDRKAMPFFVHEDKITFEVILPPVSLTSYHTIQK